TALHPGAPQARAQLTAMLFETDSATWPLVAGTGLSDLVASVREWTVRAEAATAALEPADSPPSADPLVVELSTGILEAVRRQVVQHHDEALLALWLDLEGAPGRDLAR